MGEVVAWPCRGQDRQLNLKGRLESLVAIFSTINAGEMLAALPDCEIAQEQHVSALRLLAIAEGELLCLCEDVSRYD